MISELEKKSSFTAMSDLEVNKNSVEMTRYRNNTLAYSLGLGGVAFSIIAAFICLNSFNPGTAITLLKVVLNVFILLFGFLCCEKAKTYQVKGSFYLIGLGGITLLRIFGYPLFLMIEYGKWTEAVANSDTVAQLEAEKWLGNPIVNPEQLAWLPADGNVRGILAMVFMVIAAALMIVGGVLGFLKAKKLAAYLDSLKETK